jgi:hypothetical protein
LFLFPFLLTPQFTSALSSRTPLLVYHACQPVVYFRSPLLAPFHVFSAYQEIHIFLFTYPHT